MIKKKRYGGLILFLVIFLAFRPASALYVHASETGQGTGHYDSNGETSEKKSKKKFELPQVIKDYRFDADTEKKKLAEAISKLDELGFSPEKMAERLWTIISRKENREKIGKAAEDLKENTGKLIEKASGSGTDSGKDQSEKGASGNNQSDQGDFGKNDSGKNESWEKGSGKDGSGKDDSGKGESPKDKSAEDKSAEEKSQKEGSGTDESGTEDSEKKGAEAEGSGEESAKEESAKEDSVKEDSGKKNPGDGQSGKDSGPKVRKSEDAPLYERAVNEADRLKEKVREEASKKVDEAIDKVAEAAADYAVKEINETAEKVKEEVR